MLPTIAPANPATRIAHCGSPASAATAKNTMVTAAPVPQRKKRRPSILR
jgi:hypothetical protein